MTMESFKNIRFKTGTAKRFQEFSKSNFKTHTEAMATMLDFFQFNQISPKERLGPTAKTLEKALNKRLNAIIAIIRDIEKTQTKPTAAILNAILEQDEPPKKTKVVEKKVFPDSENYWNTGSD